MRYLLKSKYCEGAACALTVLLWNVFICSLCGTVTVIFCFIVRDLSPVLLLPLVWLTLHVDCVVMDFYQPGGRLTLVCTFSQGRVSPVPRLPRRRLNAPLSRRSAGGDGRVPKSSVPPESS